jgi:RNA polymerase sigma-70 factor (ECF subfamily)
MNTLLHDDSCGDSCGDSRVDSLSRLYAQHGERLVATARAILNSEDLARDAVQEALLACWRSATPPDDALAWLLRTTVHRALHHERTRRRRLAHEEHAGPGPAPRDELRAAPSRPEDGDGRELGRLVAAAIGSLPPPFRAAFVQFELSGQDYAAIARRERVPVGTVRSRLARARALLRERLGARLASDPWCLDCARSRRPARGA